MVRLGEIDEPLTVVDVPCGGGLALRGLRPGTPVRFIAIDLDDDFSYSGLHMINEVPRGTAADLAEWLRATGFDGVSVQGRGFAHFEAAKPS